MEAPNLSQPTLEKGSLSLNKLSGTIIHDLKGPVNNLHGFLQILKTDPSVKGVDPALLELMEKSCEKLNSLLTDLLEINKINSGHYKAESSHCDLSELLKDSIDQNLIAVYRKKLKIRLDLDSELEINADRQKICRAFENVLSNAIKFSFEGSNIDIRTYRKGKHVCLEVKDYGTGMKIDTIKLLNEPFSVEGQKGTHGEKSTGFGLYITKYIISTLHGGEVEITSKENEGTTVCLLLPL